MTYFLTINYIWDYKLETNPMLGYRASDFYFKGGSFLICLCCFVLIGYLEANRDGVTAKVFGNPVAAFIGRISYSVYLWHYPIDFWSADQQFLHIQELSHWESSLLKFGLSLLLGAISYALVE